MINLTYILNKMKVASMAMLLPIIACSCSMMHEDMGECKQELRLKFKYDKNMKFADAFSSQVKTLYRCMLTTRTEKWFSTKRKL